jgi:hypothetical protein
MNLLGRKEQGELAQQLGQISGLRPEQAQVAMDELARLAAQQLQKAAAADPELMGRLDDLLDGDGEVALGGADAVVDGKAILGELYGSQRAALAALAGAVPEVPAGAIGRLAPVAAASVVAAVLQQRRSQPQGGALTAVGGGGSLIGSIIGALVAGAIQGAIRQISASARRSTSTRRTRGTTKRARTTRKKSKKTSATNTSRRTSTVSLEDILGSIFGNRSQEG